MIPNLYMLDELDVADPLEEDPFLGGGLGSMLGSLLGEEEDEYEFEDGFYDDGELTDILGEDSGQQAAMLMELIGDQLAEADGEGEADDFLPLLGALAPLAMKALPAVAKVAAPLAKKVVPHLARGIMSLGKKVLRSPQARQLARTLPTIARNTAADVFKTYSRTGRMNSDTIKRATARQAAKVLRSPRARRAAVSRNRRFCRRARSGLRFA
jgi:hypothetical protein